MTAKKWNFYASAYHLFRKNPISAFILKRERKAIESLLKNHPIKRKNRALDIGVGRGESLRFSNDYDGRFAVDFSASMIEKCKSDFPKLHFRVAEAENLPFEGQFFVFVSMIGVAEYIKDLEAVFASVSRVLKEDGVFIVTTSPESLTTSIRRMLGNQIYLHNKEYLLELAKRNNLNLLGSAKSPSQNLFLLKKV